VCVCVCVWMYVSERWRPKDAERPSESVCLYECVCMCVYVCVCVCVCAEEFLIVHARALSRWVSSCVSERERERESVYLCVRCSLSTLLLLSPSIPSRLDENSQMGRVLHQLFDLGLYKKTRYV